MTSTSANSNKKISAIRIENSESIETEETLAEELPLQVKINGEAYTVTMRTPGHDLFLARGLIHTENLLVDDSVDLKFEEDIDEANGTVSSINVTVPVANLSREIKGERALAATSSCGLCGKTKLEDIEVIGCPLTIHSDGPFLESEKLPAMMDAMRIRQKDFDHSGGTHAAALFDRNGDLLEVFEDIGRHNAVDKVIGWSLFKKQVNSPSIMLVSGRLSYEIISKAWRGSIPIIVAVSAPSSLAVSAANRLGITLLGFCRGNRVTIYTHPKRVKLNGNSISNEGFIH